MKHRHHLEHEKHRKHGGRAHHAEGGKVDFYAGGESNTAKEAEEKKHGGKVHKKHGGKVKHMGHMEGHHGKHRMDRPGRKRGGGVGADMKPMSSAAKTAMKQEGHKTESAPDVEGG
ncbi:MAG: hypothetical protein KGL39_04530 [Patescibacteria group bacterium]|nr:hypothetical protein [Patescibacteria group bacterium]